MSYSQPPPNPNPQGGGSTYSGPQQSFPQWNPNASQSGYNPGYQGNLNASQSGYNPGYPGNQYNQGYTASTDFGSQQNYQQPQQYSQPPQQYSQPLQQYSQPLQQYSQPLQQYSQPPQQWGQQPYNAGSGYGPQGIIGAPPQQSTVQPQWQPPAAPHQQYSSPNHQFASSYTNSPSQPPFPHGSAPQSGPIPFQSPPTTETEASAAGKRLPPNIRKALERFTNGLDNADQGPEGLRALMELPSEENQAKLRAFGAGQQLDVILARWRSLLEKKRVLLSENKKSATVSKLIPTDASTASTSRSTTSKAPKVARHAQSGTAPNPGAPRARDSQTQLSNAFGYGLGQSKHASLPVAPTGINPSTTAPAGPVLKLVTPTGQQPPAQSAAIQSQSQDWVMQNGKKVFSVSWGGNPHVSKKGNVDYGKLRNGKPNNGNVPCGQWGLSLNESLAPCKKTYDSTEGCDLHESCLHRHNIQQFEINELFTRKRINWSTYSKIVLYSQSPPQPDVTPLKVELDPPAGYVQRDYVSRPADWRSFMTPTTDSPVEKAPIIKLPGNPNRHTGAKAKAARKHELGPQEQMLPGNMQLKFVNAENVIRKIDAQARAEAETQEANATSDKPILNEKFTKIGKNGKPMSKVQQGKQSVSVPAPDATGRSRATPERPPPTTAGSGSGSGSATTPVPMSDQELQFPPLLARPKYPDGVQSPNEEYEPAEFSDEDFSEIELDTGGGVQISSPPPPSPPPPQATSAAAPLPPSPSGTMEKVVDGDHGR